MRITLETSDLLRIKKRCTSYCVLWYTKSSIIHHWHNPDSIEHVLVSIRPPIVCFIQVIPVVANQNDLLQQSFEDICPGVGMVLRLTRPPTMYTDGASCTVAQVRFFFFQPLAAASSQVCGSSGGLKINRYRNHLLDPLSHAELDPFANTGALMAPRRPRSIRYILFSFRQLPANCSPCNTIGSYFLSYADCPCGANLQRTAPHVAFVGCLWWFVAIGCFSRAGMCRAMMTSGPDT